MQGAVGVEDQQQSERPSSPALSRTMSGEKNDTGLLCARTPGRHSHVFGALAPGLSHVGSVYEVNLRPNGPFVPRRTQGKVHNNFFEVLGRKYCRFLFVKKRLDRWIPRHGATFDAVGYTPNNKLMLYARRCTSQTNSEKQTEHRGSDRRTPREELEWG